MKTFYSFALLTLYICVFTACKDDNNFIDGKSISKNYIGKYQEVDSIYASTSSKDTFYISESCIYLYFIGKLVLFRGTEDQEKFQHYSTVFGDTSYNQEIDLMASPVRVANHCQTLTLLCDKDYDAKHPAGTSLNDIVEIEYRSPYYFIKNGYSEEGLSETQKPHRKKRLSEMMEEDFLLIEPDVTLRILAPPLATSVYTFKLTLKTDKKDYETSITNILIK